MRKTILITGSTDGIGNLAAMKLARAGHKVIIHGRNSEKVAKVVSQIKEETANQNTEGVVADFSVLANVKAFTIKLSSQLSQLDVLINNAGVFKTSTPVTTENLDIRMTVNYLAPYILTQGLMPLLKASPSGQIINLSSAAQASVSCGLVQGKILVSDSAAYAQSKLALLMWSFYLAKQEPDLSVVALNPGSMLNTNMVRAAYGHSMGPASKGADIIYDLVMHDKLAQISGQYFCNDNRRFSRAHEDTYNSEKIDKLLTSTETVLSTMLSD